MGIKQQIEVALRAADQPIWIDSPQKADEAATAWHGCELIGLDTEFVRERTYYARLGLVQVSDGHQVWLLDPLVKGTLAPVKRLLCEARTTKILHSPSEDLEIFHNILGQVPDPMVDTQVACALLGQPLQVGYHVAIDWLLGVTLDKDQTRSDWCARPLRQAQLHYAALDVCLLPLAWGLLADRLEQAGRMAWFTEDCQRQLDKARQSTPAEDQWQRIRGSGRLDGTSLAVLQALAAWREGVAVASDRPRNFIVPDAALVAIAGSHPADASGLADIPGLHPRAAQRHGQTIFRIIARALDEGRSLPTEKPLSTAQRKNLGRLRDRVAARAAELGMEPALLATRRELEELERSHGETLPERLQGWRYQVIGQDLLEMTGSGKR